METLTSKIDHHNNWLSHFAQYIQWPLSSHQWWEVVGTSPLHGECLLLEVKFYIFIAHCVSRPTFDHLANLCSNSNMTQIQADFNEMMIGCIEGVSPVPLLQYSKSLHCMSAVWQLRVICYVSCLWLSEPQGLGIRQPVGKERRHSSEVAIGAFLIEQVLVNANTAH